MSNNPIHANNPFISRTLPKFVTPPRTALSVKNHLCKIEGLSTPTSPTLFESLSSETAAVESSRLGFGGCSSSGSSENDHIVLVVGVEEAEKRLASTAQSERLPEAVLPEPRYGTFQNVMINNPCLLVSVQSIIASMTKMAHWHPRCLLIRKTHPWAASTRTPSHHHKQSLRWVSKSQRPRALWLETFSCTKTWTERCWWLIMLTYPFKPRLTRDILRMNP